MRTGAAAAAQKGQIRSRRVATGRRTLPPHQQRFDRLEVEIAFDGVGKLFERPGQASAPALHTVVWTSARPPAGLGSAGPDLEIISWPEGWNTPRTASRGRASG